MPMMGSAPAFASCDDIGARVAGPVSSLPMLTSVKWLNRYLDPAGVTADEAEHVLTHVGFPIESREEAPGGDVRLDVELTSNRGDCLCHVGLAREMAAATGRQLAAPGLGALPPRRGTHGAAASLTNVE